MMDLWSTCNICEDEITQIEADSFDNRCQHCYLGLSKYKKDIITSSFFTLMSSMLKKDKRKELYLELNIAFVSVGILEVKVAAREGNLAVINVQAFENIANGVLLHSLIDDILSYCVDFEEVVQYLREHSVG